MGQGLRIKIGRVEATQGVEAVEATLAYSLA